MSWNLQGNREVGIPSTKTGTDAGRCGTHLGIDAQFGFLTRLSRKDKRHSYFKSSGEEIVKSQRHLS